MGRQKGWGSQVTGRPVMCSPGRPTAGNRDDRVVFWHAIAVGVATVDAARLAGVSEAVGVRWFRERGGMPTVTLTALSGRAISECCGWV
jgi:hypothetical protein